MKKLLTISLTLLFSAFLNAQGTLQFDHVEYIQAFVDPNLSSWCEEQTITVDPNTVWKITSVTTPSRVTSSNTLYYKEPAGSIDAFLLLNNSVISNKDVPIWLPAGTYTLKFCEKGSGATFYYSNLSAIVFNIIP